MLTIGLTLNAQNKLDPTGNVGVGTMNPSAKLDVNGKMRVDSSVWIKDSVQIDKKLTVKQDLKINGESVFTDKMKASSEIKILGTTKMKGDAFVEGSFKFKNLANSSAEPFEFLMLNPNGKVSRGGLSSIGQMLSSKDCFGSNANWASLPNVLYTGVDCPAKVGIGINAPLTSLDVIGRGRFSAGISLGNYTTDSYFNINANSSWNNMVTITKPSLLAPMFQINDAGNLGVNQSAVNYIQFSVTNKDNVTGFCVDNTDFDSNTSYSYGIKTIVNGDKAKALAVNDAATGDDVFIVWGNGVVNTKKIYSTEVQVQNNTIGINWPDYVFKPSYNLMSIKDLKTFININNHLPNVPSQKQVIAEGVNLAETQAALLEKIEELTLYTIQQEEKIEDLEKSLKELESLKAQIKELKELLINLNK